MERIPTFSVVVEFSSVPAFQWGQLAFDIFFALSFLYLFFYLHALHALRMFIWYADWPFLHSISYNQCASEPKPG